MELIGILRQAQPADVDLYFRWANDSVARANGYSTMAIPYADHVQWFAKKLNDPNCLLYVLMSDAIPIGQLRFDMRPTSEAVISYAIDVAMRGKGYGLQLLKLGEEQILRDYPNVQTIVGYVKNSNIASRRVFQKLGYDEFPTNEYPESVMYCKQLFCDN